MVKHLNIHAKYEGKSHILECSADEFLGQVSKYFKIDVSEIEIYDKDKKSISPSEIKDFMKIEIVNKSRKSNMDNQRTMRSYFPPGESGILPGEPSKRLTTVEKIINKLMYNNTLTGTERKFLVDHLQDSAKNPAPKRNHDNELNSPLPKRVHKKVQANPSKDFTKESFTQTDLALQTRQSHSEENEDPVTKLKKIAANGDDGESNKEEVKRLMDTSYEDRRHYILLKIPLVAAVRDKYPLLFSLNEVKNELNRLFYLGKCEDFISNIDRYASIILNECDPENEIVKRTKKYSEKGVTSKQRKYAEAVGSILALPSLMEEELGFINLIDNPYTSDVFPYVDASVHTLKDIFSDVILFKVITEDRLLCEASNFKEAILCLMASFFIFNIGYPEHCQRTLIMFEKIYLCANDTTELDGHTQQMIKFLKLKAKLH